MSHHQHLDHHDASEQHMLGSGEEGHHGFEGEDEHSSQMSVPDGGRSRKKRAYKKAPEAPTRGRSAYVLYSMEKREQVKESLPPGTRVTEVMKQIAAKWRALSDEEKQPWITKAAEDKTRYEQELSVYDGPLKVPNKRAKKDPLAPKRAMSAFLHFSQSMRPRLRDTYPEARNMDMSKMLGQEWNRMSEEEKLPYQAKAQDDTARYREAMMAWRHGGNPEAGHGVSPEEEGDEQYSFKDESDRMEGYPGPSQSNDSQRQMEREGQPRHQPAVQHVGEGGVSSDVSDGPGGRGEE